MKAYRDAEYGSWYHHCLYVESERPLKVKNITEEYKASKQKDDEKKKGYIKAKNESIIDVFDDLLEEMAVIDLDKELQLLTEDSSKILEEPVKKTDDMESIKNTVEKISKKYESFDKNDKIKYMSKVLNACKTILKIIACFIGADRIIDGVNGLNNSKKMMRDIKNEMPMNHETYNKIKYGFVIKHILSIIQGIVVTALNCYTLGSIATNTFTKNKNILFIIVNTLDTIIEACKITHDNGGLEKTCKQIQKNCNTMQAMSEAANDYCDIVDIEDAIYETISNVDIMSICESISNHEEPQVLTESSEESYYEESEQSASISINDNGEKNGFNITFKKECFDVGEVNNSYEYLINHYFGTFTNLIHETKGQTIIITNDKLIPQIRKVLEEAGLSNVEYSKNTHDRLTPIYRFERDNLDVLVADDNIYGLIFNSVSLILVINAEQEAMKYMDLCMHKNTRHDITIIDIHAVNSLKPVDESIMSIANISPIVTPIKFKDIPEHKSSSLEKAIEQAKICLNESVESLTDYAAHFCPETLDEHTGAFNPVKDSIKKRSCIVETVKKHKGNFYVTSDIHIFGKLDDSHVVDTKMVRYIINNFNSKIKPNDTLLILGDIGHRDDKNLRWHTKWFIDQLRCKNIWLVLGNHDLLGIEEYKKMGCSIVCHKLLYNGYEFTHYPIKSKFNFHGHIHNQLLTKYDNINYDNHINVFYHMRQDLPTFEELLKNEITMHESNFDMSGVIFGDGEFSSICDSRIDNFVTGNSNEDITANSVIGVDANMFSPNIQKMPYSYSEPSNNFVNNEEIRVDLQTDPGYSGESDSILPDIAKSIYASNFNDNN